MSVARHPRPPELADTPIEEIMQRYVGRFKEKKPDWAAFEDAKIEGFKRAQHRFIGAGGSGKHGDPNAIPARAHTLSIMYVEPGQGNFLFRALEPHHMAVPGAETTGCVTIPSCPDNSTGCP